MSKQDALIGFDPNTTGNTGNNIFGLPFSPGNARVVFIPMPWDASVSNFEGTSAGPSKIFEASFQIDLIDHFAPEAWKQGFAMEAIDPSIEKLNRDLRRKSAQIINFLEAGGRIDEKPSFQLSIDEINNSCEALCIELEQKSLIYIKNNQIPVVVGGDHSVPLGLIRALGRAWPGFGILQIDAHADMRHNYQGFNHSHASIMFNTLKTNGVSKLVQVGIREICPEEAQTISHNSLRVNTFYDRDIQNRLFEGETWSAICHEIVSHLPHEVYVSFDVDGLDPSLCPGTGTPLPGGLSFNQAVYLLETILNQGKKIIGADLVETGPTNIDGIVSSRLLFKLAGMIVKSNP